MNNIHQHAEYLLKAEEENHLVDCLTKDHPDLSLEDAYAIQDRLVELKQETGHSISALKMGFTSKGKMRQMGIDDPIHGKVFEYMEESDGAELVFDEYLHPKAEAELAFKLGGDISGAEVTAEEVLEKTEYVFPMVEIIDSRYRDFKFTLPDVIADNTSAKRVVYSNQLFSPEDFRLDDIGVTLYKNGEAAIRGVSAFVMDHPANSVAALAKMLHERDGRGLRRGDLILTGGITEAVLLSKGDHVVADFEGMGEVVFDIK